MERTIDDVVSCLKHSRNGCSLLIGAGVSANAGIPLAGQFVEIIEERFGDDRMRYAAKRDYPSYMNELFQDERKQLIDEFVGKARINWAHIAIASLLLGEKVDRILTTNFDPLVMRACAMIGVYPAIYDFASSQHFKASFVPDRAVFHLHGQSAGFVQLHTEQECKKHYSRLKPVFENATEGRPWIVIGYSGENDPVFKRLSAVRSFDAGLFWVGYQDSEPAPHVRDGLLTGSKDAYYVRGFDADTFLVQLAQRLGCFPPPFFKSPLDHLKSELDRLTPYELIEGSSIDLLAHTHAKIDAAISSLEETAQQAEAAMMAGDYERAIELGHKAEPDSPVACKTLPWAYTMLGNALQTQAENESDSKADALFGQSHEMYGKAVDLKPDLHEAFNNWGNALSDQANLKSGSEADALFGQSHEKYARAADIKPDYHVAFRNWGIALSDQARQKSDLEADALFGHAYEKYARAVDIKPNDHEAFHHWGSALQAQAKNKWGSEADALFGHAHEKYAKAVDIKPDYHRAFYNWGNALSNQANRKSGSEADALFGQSHEKYARAVDIKPDYHRAFHNWGNALSNQANRKSGSEADALFGQSHEKFARAVDIKPDYYRAFHNWGNALSNQANRKSGSEADALFGHAHEKYARAVNIKPDYHLAFRNWGLALSDQARRKPGSEADALFGQSYEKYANAVDIKPDDHLVFNSWGNALQSQAKNKSGSEADALFGQSHEKYARAVVIKSDNHLAFKNWGNALLKQATKKSGPDADELIGLAEKKLQHAETLSAGSGSYDLACIAALRSDETTCRQWLEACVRAGKLPSVNHVQSDSDLGSVRECEWFAELVEGAGEADG